jgi:hypothetical protein
MAVTLNGHDTQAPAPLEAETGTMRYLLDRLDALEKQVQDLSEWLAEVADDLLDRTET